MSLSNRIGELFISGFPGSMPSAKILRQIEELSLGGIILFEENCVEHKTLRRTIERLQASSDKLLLIAIDQEGGRVCRLKGEPVEYLASERYGSGAEQSAEALEVALALYRKDFESAVEYLSDLGINLLLGPVCDLRPEPGVLSESTALNGRTFSADPKVVGAFAKATIELAHKHNLLCCLKHVPGLGSVRADPHVSLGSSDSQTNDSQGNDSQEDALIPFRIGCEAGADMMMTSHFLIPALDTVPVTFSGKIVTSLIRDRLSNEAALITDDLNMGALSEFGEAGNMCLSAFNAGHDLLLARSNDTALEGISALQNGFEIGSVGEMRLCAALERVDSLRHKLEQTQ